MKEKDDLVCIERAGGGLKLKHSGMLKLRLEHSEAATYFQLRRADAKALLRGLQRFLKEVPAK